MHYPTNKPGSSGIVPANRQPSGTLSSSLLFKARQPGLTYLSNFGAAPMAVKPILLLEKLAEVTLVGIGVTTLIGNPLICGCLLVLEPASVVKTLVALAT
ncbi:MAG TPA: hypothetical protein VGN90_01620 [Pyrinomonadaceae bacterium]|jgi:hypothetical protein|nr:hypothetical protein [Pyrinomonadaceae bacterium]